MNDTARSQHVTQKEQDLNGRTVDEVHNLVLVVLRCGGQALQPQTWTRYLNQFQF